MARRRFASGGAAPTITPEQKRAWASVQKFNKMTSTLTSFARALTGNPRIIVKAGPNTQTDGNTIWIRPPLALGDPEIHDKQICGERDHNRALICEACRASELLWVHLHHEMSHIIMGSTTTHPSSGLLEELTDLVNEWHPKGACTHSDDIIQRARYQTSYITFFDAFSPFLTAIVKPLEDARIDTALMKAKPGLKKAFYAGTYKTMTDGVEQPNGSVMRWYDQAPNLQATIAVLLVGKGYPVLDGWLRREIVDLIVDNPKVQKLLATVPNWKDVHDTASYSIQIFRILNSLGLFEIPKCTPPEPDQPAPPSDEPAENEDKSDDDQQDSGDESGEPESDDNSGEDSSDSSSDDADASDDGGDGSGDGGDDSEESGEGGGGEQQDATGDGTAGDTADDSAFDNPDGSSAGGDKEDEPPNNPSDGEPVSGDDGDNESEAERSEDQPGDGDSGSGDDADSDGEHDQADSDSADSPEGQDQTGEDDSEEDLPGDSGASSSDEPSDSDVDGDAQVGDGDVSGEPARPESSSSPEDGDTQDDGDAADDGDEDGSEGGETSDDAGTEGDDGDSERLKYDENGEPVTEDPESEIELEVPTQEEEDEDPWEGDYDPLSGFDGDFGSPEDIERMLEVLEEHESIEPLELSDDPDSLTAAAEALTQALRQSLYFDTSSVGVGGVIEYEFPATVVGWVPRWRKTAKSYLPSEAILGHSLMKARRVFADNRKSRNEANLKSGRINSRVLGRRAALGDERLFKQKHIPAKRDYVIGITMDCSGSNQQGNRMERAKRSVMAKAELLHRLGVKFYITAHTGGFERWFTSGYDDADFDAAQDLMILWVKKLDEPWTDKARERLAAIEPMANNFDGHTLEFHRKLLEEQKATDKILIYYTDGAMPAANYAEELEILQRELKNCDRAGIVRLAVGINTNSPSRYGFDTVEVRSDEDLGKVVDHLEKYLTR